MVQEMTCPTVHLYPNNESAFFLHPEAIPNQIQQKNIYIQLNLLLLSILSFQMKPVSC